MSLLKTLSLLGVGIIVIFTNCGRFTIKEVSSSSQNFGGPIAVEQALKVNAESNLGHRDYVASVLKLIFTPTGQENTIDDVISQEIRGNIGLFGGSCNVYSSLGLADCSAQNKTQSDTVDTIYPFSQPSSTAREARRVRACERILDRTGAVLTAIAKISSAAISVKPSPGQAREAFELFYPGQAPTSAVESSLQDLVAEAADPAAAWQMLLYSLCASPGWQRF